MFRHSLCICRERQPLLAFLRWSPDVKGETMVRLIDMRIAMVAERLMPPPWYCMQLIEVVVQKSLPLVGECSQLFSLRPS
mmetsp:Transcript_44311/g.82807  ORF Transcript_44311/g.82807 Transcript_44311/m.82807 type:complete len:80 (+) Transcript_44311:114-353(+)